MPRIKIEPGASGKIDTSGTGFRALFDNFFSSQRPLFSLSGKMWNPPADVYETADSVVIKIEIAGVSRDQLDINIDPEQNVLVVKGCRREGPQVKKDHYYLMEIRYGHFERAFPLPSQVQHEDIQAQYSNGFLIVTIPRKPNTKRDIPIRMVDE